MIQRIQPSKDTFIKEMCGAESDIMPPGKLPGTPVIFFKRLPGVPFVRSLSRQKSGNLLHLFPEFPPLLFSLLFILSSEAVLLQQLRNFHPC